MALSTQDPIQAIHHLDDLFPLPRGWQGGDGQYSASEAKQFFFLDSKALAELPAETAGTWGRSRLRLYDAEDVRAKAIELFGTKGLQKKMEARRKREASKRMREEEAEAAAEQIKRAALEGKAVESPLTPDEKKLLQNIRATLTKSIRASLQIKLWPGGGGPDKFRVEIPNVQPKLFAHLAGIPHDPELRTIPKAGAYQTICPIKLRTIIQVSHRDVHKAMRGLDLYAGKTVELKYKAATMTLSINGYAVDYEPEDDSSEEEDDEY